MQTEKQRALRLTGTSEPVIWKYEIPLTKTFRLVLPAGAAFIRGATQMGKPHLWCRVRPDAKPEAVYFVFIMTGQHHNADTLMYVCTFDLPNGDVWHLHVVK